MAHYLGDFAEDTTDITFAWDSNDALGASVTRTTDGTVYVEKVGALASSSATAATITKANPGVVTDVAHGLENGDEVFFYNLTEMTEVNQTIQTVANKAADTFEIENTSGHGAAETTGGAWVQVNAADVTDTEDYKDVTGSHLCAIDTVTDAYFVAAADYIVYLNAATIDGETVNATLAQFSIENRFAEVDVVKWLGQAVTADTNVPEVHVVGMDDDVIAAAKFATDAIAADGLAADAVAEIVAGLKASTGWTVGGTATYLAVMKAMYALARGKVAVTGDAAAYKDDDDTTTLFTLTFSSSGRTSA